MLIGLVIIGLGVTLLPDQEGVVRVWDVWRFWPLILVVVGLIRLLRASSIPDRMWGMVEILFGVVFQLGALGYQRFEFSRTWPLLVIGVGLWVLYGKLPWPRRSDGGDTMQSTLDFNRTDVFGGGKVRVTSKNFRGGKWLAVIGGSQVDFTEANMEGNEATLKILAVFGGGEIIIPRNWEVQVHGMAFFGGHNDETQPPLEVSDLRKRLIITGAWVFGGFNVRNSRRLMHPILLNFRRLSLYLLGWTFLAVLVADQLATSGELGWALGAALSVPLCLVYAFVCLSSWYVCRLTPLRLRNVESVLTVHLAASVVASFLWILIARAVAVALFGLKLFVGPREHLARATGLLFGLGVVFYLLTVAMHYVLLASEASRQAEEREAQARILAREAELRALKAQVNPHFLFNSLHSISALTSVDPSQAREMCIQLGDFLRRTLGLGEKLMIPLGEELALVESYLRVEQARFGSRLTFEKSLDAGTLDAAIPPLLLQPLVENAIVHGISNLPEGGWIRLSAHRQRDDLELVVENKFDVDSPSPRHNGVGLKNVRQRLDACFGSRARISAGRDGGCFRVSLTLPLESKAGEP